MNIAGPKNGTGLTTPTTSNLEVGLAQRDKKEEKCER